MKFSDGDWTQARFNSFIKSGLRALTHRWAPKNRVRTKARIKRGWYLCQGVGRSPHEVPVSIKNNKGKRVNNIQIDHIKPIIPITGFTTWDDVIRRLFCDSEGLQLLCLECHKLKTSVEDKQRKETE